MITLPIKVLARYMLAGPRDRNSILQDQKFEPDDRLTAMRFHNTARNAIVAYHRANLTVEQLDAMVVALRGQAKDANRFARAELVSNADIIQQWVALQAQRRLVVTADRRYELRRTNIQLTAKPNLVATEHGVRRLVFFAFGKQSDETYKRLLARLAFEIASLSVVGLRPGEIEVVDRFANGVDASPRSTTLSREIAVACAAISKSWPTVQPPPGRTRESGRDDGQLTLDWHPPKA